VVERNQRVGQQEEDAVGRTHQEQVVPHAGGEKAQSCVGSLGEQLFRRKINLKI
jgi:hypothetical protein